jgi:hypothetical protein
LITTCTICDIFENLGSYLILTQSTGTENAFNPEKQRQALGVKEGERCGVYKERGNWKEVKKVKEILV